VTPSIVIGAGLLAVTYGIAVFGCRLQSALPARVLDADVRDVLKVLIGVLGTLSALVLSLLINSARASYDQQHQEVMELSAKLLSLDRALARVGPEAMPLRHDLKTLVAAAVEGLWPADGSRAGRIAAPVTEEAWVRTLQALPMHDDARRVDRDQAVGLATDVMNLRWLLYEQSAGSIPGVVLAVLAVWFVLIFLCIGLISPPKPPVLLRALVFLSCASVSAAMMLGIELERPFDGLLRVSGAPVLNALSHLGG
jgi:hypothetical protein